MPEPLTPLEQRVYHYLIDFLAENTYQPSIREIAKQFRIKSTKTVSDLLHALTAKGYIERDQSRSRGVRLIGMATGVAGTQPVPCYAQVRAVEPVLAPENRESFITIDRRFLPTGDCYFVRAGDSAMAERGILEGDFLLVSPGTRASDGEQVVVRVGDQTIARTLQRRGGTIVLEAAGADERPIELGPRDDYAILGAVAGVFRPHFQQLETPSLPIVTGEMAVPVS